MTLGAGEGQAANLSASSGRGGAIIEPCGPPPLCGYNYSTTEQRTLQSGFGEEGFHLGSLGVSPGLLNPINYSQHNGFPAHQINRGGDTSYNYSNQPVSNGYHINQSGGHPGGIDIQGPIFPPQNLDIPDISVSNSLFDSQLHPPPLTAQHHQTHLTGHYQVQGHSGQLNLNHPYRLANLGYNTPNLVGAMSGNGSGSNQSSPSRSGSELDSSGEDSLPLSQLAGLKRGTPMGAETSPPQGGVKKPKAPKRRRKKDPNEPQKPVSAYALFFRDTQAAIKGQNPNASFGDVSKIVASMWDNLDAEQKSNYKKRTEVAKKEYLKQLAAYRASLVSKQSVEEHSIDQSYTGDRSPSQQPQMMGPHGQQMAPFPPGAGDGVGQGQQQMVSLLPPLQSINSRPQQQSPPSVTMATTGMNNQQMAGLQDGQVMGSPSPGGSLCVRNGCPNPAIEHSQWENQYCSSNCGVSHCRDVFTAWVASRQGSYASVK